MALKKPITNPNGTVTEYHRLDNGSITKTKDNLFKISYSLSSYINESYRRLSAFNHVERTTSYLVQDTVPTDVFKAVYNHLKSTPKYVNALDI